MAEMTEAELRKEHGDELVDRARLRVVTHTKYGWRVAYDRSLDGEYEINVSDGKPRAYWPRKEENGSWRCRCRWGRQRKMCSHILAVLLRTGENVPDVPDPDPFNGAEIDEAFDHDGGGWD